MKIIKRISVLLLALTLLFSVACAAPEENKKPEGETTTQTTYTKLKAIGVHNLKYTETDNYLVQNGASEYVIVTPSVGGNKYTAWAWNELQFFFKEATGVELAQRTDSGLTYTEDAKYISIGDTALAEQAGITYDKEALGRDGVRIITKGNTIFILGDSWGVLYGVYDFLEIEFDYDYFDLDTYTINRYVQNHKLKNYDLTDIPDIPSRARSVYRFLQYDGVNEDANVRLAERMRQPFADNTWMYLVGGRATHNAIDVLPPDDYSKAHPKWYSGDFMQPCFTAHGDEVELEAMITEVARIFCEYLEKAPVANNLDRVGMGFTIEDGNYHCMCPACTAEKEKYGGFDSSYVIKFMNRLAEKVNAWMDLPENEEHKRDVKYMFFGYHWYTEAPVKLNEATGNYEVLAPELQPHEDVGVWLCSSVGDYYDSLYTEANYTNGLDIIKQWSDILDTIALWTYDANYHNKMMPDDRQGYFDNDFYNAMSAMSVDFYYQEGLNGYDAVSHFGRLKSYLQAKLCWNANLDVEELVNKWFITMFGDAAEAMYDYYEELRMFRRQQYTDYIIGGNNQVNAEYWPYQELMKWSNMCQRATEYIEDLKYTDIVEYERLLGNINIERVTADYLLSNLYREYFSNEDFKVLRDRLLATATENPRMGITGEGDLLTYAESL